ncbi:MAG: hypothetical protein ABS938_00910 [Psychrobacillus psychrodurans]
MSFRIKGMQSFPVANTTRETYDIVFIGEVIPNYGNSRIPDLLNNQYVFLFVTKNVIQNKEACDYGHVNIHLVRYDSLSNFNYMIRERGSFHILKNERLLLNDFLEVVPEATKEGIQITAYLKKQKISKDDKVITVKNYRVLLVRENNHMGHDNVPVLSLGAKFQAQIDYEMENEYWVDLMNSSRVIQDLINRNPNSEVKKAAEVIAEVLAQEEERVKTEMNRIHSIQLKTGNWNRFH